MPRVTRVMALALAVLLAGCEPVYNLEPAISAADAIRDERIEGRWEVVSDGDSRVEVTAQEGMTYRLSAFDADSSSEHMQGRLGLIGGVLFIELRPAMIGYDSGWPVARILARVRLEGELLMLAGLPQDEIIEIAVEQGVPMLRTNGELILTGTGSQVRRVVEAFIQSGEGFEDEIEYRRVVP